MEPWRLIATALLVLAGLVLVLVTMAKVRDRTGRGSTVAVSGAIAVTLLALLSLLTLTVLPQPVAWGATVAVGAVVAAMLLVG